MQVSAGAVLGPLAWCCVRWFAEAMPTGMLLGMQLCWLMCLSSMLEFWPTCICDKNGNPCKPFLHVTHTHTRYAMKFSRAVLWSCAEHVDICQHNPYAGTYNWDGVPHEDMVHTSFQHNNVTHLQGPKPTALVLTSWCRLRRSCPAGTSSSTVMWCASRWRWHSSAARCL